MADKKTVSVLIKAIDALTPTLKKINTYARQTKRQLDHIGKAGAVSGRNSRCRRRCSGSARRAVS